MSNIDKQWLQQTIAEMEEHRDMFHGDLDADHGKVLAALRIALASLEAEASGRNPVLAYADSYRDMANQGVESIPVWCVITDLERNIAPLFTAPPAPVSVPDEITSANAPEVFEIAAEAERLGLRGAYASYAVGWNACRAAMLQGADEVGSWNNNKNTPTSRAYDEHFRYEYNAGGNLWIQCSKQKYERMKAAGMLTGVLTRVFYDTPQNQQQNIPENIPTMLFKPVADLYGLTSPTGGETSFTFDAVEARDFIDGGWSCQGYVELGRFQEAMLQNGNSPAQSDCCPDQNYIAPAQDGDSPVIPDGWVACSERMPKFGDYLVTDGKDFDVQMFNGEQFIPGFVWEDNITHWMPLPAAPKQGE